MIPIVHEAPHTLNSELISAYHGNPFRDALQGTGAAVRVGVVAHPAVVLQGARGMEFLGKSLQIAEEASASVGAFVAHPAVVLRSARASSQCARSSKFWKGLHMCLSERQYGASPGEAKDPVFSCIRRPPGGCWQKLRLCAMSPPSYLLCKRAGQQHVDVLPLPCPHTFILSPYTLTCSAYGLGSSTLTFWPLRPRMSYPNIWQAVLLTKPMMHCAFMMMTPLLLSSCAGHTKGAGHTMRFDRRKSRLTLLP